MMMNLKNNNKGAYTNMKIADKTNKKEKDMRA
jgi:hypothetical protein